MGFNTAFMVLNDHLSEIAKDKNFGEKLRYSITVGDRDPFAFNHGVVLPTQHADTMQIIAVGGNTARTMGFGTWTQDDLALIKILADKHGYTLTKKRTRRK